MTRLWLLSLLLLTSCGSTQEVTLDDTNEASRLCNAHGTLSGLISHYGFKGKSLNITCHDGSELVYYPPNARE